MYSLFVALDENYSLHSMKIFAVVATDAAAVVVEGGAALATIVSAADFA